ncbi:MAG TPA: MEDS domain-containing protein [Verrucomicrobiae bacterium]|nr:MEDS domain-containing protein [Verrucomicrobiae bacterium]
MSLQPTTKQFEHLVQFYSSEEVLVSLLADYCIKGFNLNETCIVIATDEHVSKLESKLLILGFDPYDLINEERFVVIDAHVMLSHIMQDGMPNPKLFEEVLGNMFAGISAPGQKIRAFGEMVAILWQGGNERAAIMLEKLWNNLGKNRNFMLLCSYPASIMGRPEDKPYLLICDEHSQVIENGLQVNS